jgi:hypothetical protein
MMPCFEAALILSEDNLDFGSPYVGICGWIVFGTDTPNCLAGG